MPRSVRDLVQTLLGSRDGVLPTVQAFPPVDKDQLWKELQLEAEAKRRRQEGQRPPLGEADSSELEIDQAIEIRARKAAEEYETRRHQYEARIQRASVGADQRATIEAAGQNALTDFQARIAEDQDSFTLAIEEVRAREREFQEFRATHQLTRLPHLVSSRWRTFTYLVIGVLAVVESCLNGLLFAQGSAAGIVGGIGQALMLSAVNIGVAIIFAELAMPYWWHNSRPLKLIAALSTLTFGIWLPTWNLLIGHYRDLYIANDGSVSLPQVWRDLIGHPLGLSDVLSAALVGFGMLVSIAVVFKLLYGYEHYPGFAAVGKKRARAIAQYAVLKADCIARISDLRDEAVADLEGAVELLRNSEFEREHASEGRSHLHNVYRAYLEHLATVRQWLTSKFRAVCCLNTADSAGFTRPLAPLPSLTAPALVQMPDVAQDSRRAAIDRIETYITRINERFERTLEVYRPVEELIMQDHNTHAAA